MTSGKIIVTGALRSGKSSFIRCVSELDLPPVNHTQESLDNTIPKFDFGRITAGEKHKLYLLGMSYDFRHVFAWDSPIIEALGFIVVVDATQPENFSQAHEFIEVLRRYSHAPFIVIANRHDHPKAQSLEKIRDALSLNSVGEIVPCNAIDKAQVKTALLNLLQKVPSDTLGDCIKDWTIAFSDGERLKKGSTPT